MFNFSKDEPPAKCIITRGVLPKYIDPKQPPSKKNPFSTIASQPFFHTVDLILPQELYDVIWHQIETNISTIEYSRVIIPLSALLEGEFFNSYIKSGNIAMLSEGRPGVDNMYFLKNGFLRLELPKEVYERVGLVGHPIRDIGRKHIKSRYAIDINLRLPSMVHGKKGFERIVWAFKHVLNASVTWLFYDFNQEKGTIAGDVKKSPISEHHPTVNTCQSASKLIVVLTPPMKLPLPDDFSEEQLEIVEWLSLVVLDSPRLIPGDTINPYLCQYQIPGDDQAKICRVIKVTWKGFISAEWIKELYLNCFFAVRNHPDFWLALCANAFKTEVIDGVDGYTILTMPSTDPESFADPPSRQSLEKANPAIILEYAVWQMTSGSEARR